LFRLQRGAGNQAVASLVGADSPALMRRGLAARPAVPGPAIQRTPATAADALRKAGYTKISKKEFSTWLRAKGEKGPKAKKNSEVHAVSEADLEEVNELMAADREASAGARKIDAARARLATAQREAPGVQIVRRGVIVNLDTDQLKHQPTGYPIGTRDVGGTKWPASLGPDAAWHRANTLPVIGDWAADLDMEDGDDVPTKQSIAMSDGNHYEGFCVQVDGQKYVFFHCYPPYS
jgi:hypothetical protein